MDARVRARRREEPRGERARVWCVCFSSARAFACVVVRRVSSCVALSSFVVVAHARCVVVRARERVRDRDGGTLARAVSAY